MRSRRLQSWFRDRSIVVRFSIAVLVVSVLLLISKASLFQTSGIAQIPMQPTPSNPCSALTQRDFAAIPDAPTAILSAQIVSSTAQFEQRISELIMPAARFLLRSQLFNLSLRHFNRNTLFSTTQWHGTQPAFYFHSRPIWI